MSTSTSDGPWRPEPLSPAEQQARQILRTPVDELPGVNPVRAEQLSRLDLRTVRDLLFFFPRDYHDLTNVRRVADLSEGEMASVIGDVVDVEARQLRRRGTMIGVLLRQENDFLRGIWFNQAFMREKFTFGQRVVFSGKPKWHNGRWELTHPRVQWLTDAEDEYEGRLLPLYPLTEGLKQRHVRWLMKAMLERYAHLVDEVFPAEYLQDHALWPMQQALREIHLPASRETLELARRRFVYQELLILQLAMAVRRRQLQDSGRAPAMPISVKIDARIQRLLPFELTAGQRQAIGEISADLAQPFPMNRLLQGDVGSGKTVVAVYALLAAVAHGHQAVMMAPTEVLARQHFGTLEKMLRDSQVRRALLTGGLTERERKKLLADLAAGEIDIVVGTQAVVQDGVEFSRLGLVVIDEQHKFGVRQRAILKSRFSVDPPGTAGPREAKPADESASAEDDDPFVSARREQKRLFAEQQTAPAGPPPDPHYLVMTATPIPRTMTMTVFGDLDISTLRDSPPGRQPVHTYLAGDDRRSSWWEFFCKKLKQGRQGYVVAPLVEESDDVELTSLEQLYESLTNGELAAFRLEMLHGRMSAAEKQEVMDRFRRRDIQVLVSTTVIEVGIDVPNATLMTIEDGERFGLSQLHQLRGRISRGAHPGYCCVFANPQTEESKKRLDAFVGSTNGFDLAEADFAIRGPGDMLGTKQHGLPPFRIADLIRDQAVVEEARRDASQLITADPALAQPQHHRLRRMMLVRYGRVLNLGDVG